MLVLALEFSKDCTARGAHACATDNCTGIGAYGASGSRAPKGSRGVATGGMTRRSFPQNGRAEARRHDLLATGGRRAPCRPLLKGAVGRSLAGERGGPPSAGDGHDSE